jgi:hypothetical protein
VTNEEQDDEAVRLDAATQARIDALMPHLSAATRSEALRALLVMALEEAEKNPEQFAAQLRAQR